MSLASLVSGIFMLLNPPAAAAANLISIALSPPPVGYQEMTIGKAGGERAVKFVVWYPARTGGTETVVGENKAFAGYKVMQDAPVFEGKHGLVVISHGFGGSWRNQQWLATELVRAGYIVAAPDHPGTTTFDRSPAEAAKLWERPRDISRVIDRLLASASWSAAIDAEKIAVIGHSMGGWTVLEIAGARFDAAHLKAECAHYPSITACKLFPTLQLGTDAVSQRLIQQDLSDRRVKAVVSLDLGLARGFTPESLAAIDRPLLIFAAGNDIAGIPARAESGYLTEHMQSASFRYREIADASHFTFMQTCKPGAAAIIEQEDPGDGIVCTDAGKRSRDRIHAQVSGEIIGFLSQHLNR